GDISRRWTAIKRLYNRTPRPAKFPLVLAVGAYFVVKRAMACSLRFENPLRLPKHQPARGMSWCRDVVDWAGGYPFEVGRPEEIFDFYRARGFTMVRLKTVRNHACNEFVFRREK